MKILKVFYVYGKKNFGRNEVKGSYYEIMKWLIFLIL